MATVSTETIYCFKKEFKRVVRYKSRYQTFYITLPNGIPEKEVEAKSESEAIKLFNAAVLVHEGSITKKTKVILYGYEVDTCIYDSNDENDLCRILFDSQDNDCDFGKTFRGDGIGLRLWAEVHEKSEVILDGQDNYSNYEEVDSPIPESLGVSRRRNFSRPSDFKEIPWTPENEQFFIDVGKAFEQLILKLNSVLGDKKAILKFISSKQKLLPG